MMVDDDVLCVTVWYVLIIFIRPQDGGSSAISGTVEGPGSAPQYKRAAARQVVFARQSFCAPKFLRAKSYWLYVCTQREAQFVSRYDVHGELIAKK